MSTSNDYPLPYLDGDSPGYYPAPDIAVEAGILELLLGSCSSPGLQPMYQDSMGLQQDYFPPWTSFDGCLSHSNTEYHLQRDLTSLLPELQSQVSFVNLDVQHPVSAGPRLLDVSSMTSEGLSSVGRISVPSLADTLSSSYNCLNTMEGSTAIGSERAVDNLVGCSPFQPYHLPESTLGTTQPISINDDDFRNLHALPSSQRGDHLPAGYLSHPDGAPALRWSRTSNDKKHYKAHVRGCHDPKYKNVRFYCQFPGCSCKYKRKNDLKKHMKDNHQCGM
ncbi:hypothetical protein C8Q74DRAFT_1220981 [Fomes fomentarius]|nr:hypothetical protein C8Q74DRAFT_1220981 [Fomes fomentarius]